MKNREEEFNDLFRKEFLSFDPDPPEGAWENITSRIRQGSDNSLIEPSPFSKNIVLHRKRWLYPVLLAAGSLILFLSLWISFTGKHRIEGFALAGKEKLLHGTAYLFHVKDTHNPRDSVRMVSVKPIDSSGSFVFDALPEGTYFIRIQVHPGSPVLDHFQFGYSGNQLIWDKALLISVDTLKNPVVISLSELDH